MATLAELLLEQGIRSRGYADGTRKELCPRCSHTRKHRSDPCLSVTIEGTSAVWHCRHCQWSGRVDEHSPPREQRTRRPPLPVRPSRMPDAPTAEVLAWLARRGISEATARRNQVGAARHYVSKLQATVDCIAFPYFRNGELVNIKYRALAKKAFAQE